MSLDIGRAENPEDEDGHWVLRLYIAGQTPKSVAALANLQRLCRSRLPLGYEIEIVDLLERPELARMDQVVAIPTLVRRLPMPMKKIIGDLSNNEKVLRGLEVLPAPTRDRDGGDRGAQ